jgi:hypothetical protein
MDAEALDRIEQALGLPLPTAYRATMLDYPFPPAHEAAQLWMPDDAGVVLEMNRPIPERRLAGEPWPAHLVFIGTDGGEEDFVLDIRAPAAPVLAYERESGDVRALAPDFASWLVMLRDWQTEIDQDVAVMRAAYERKRWWQFWIPRYPP